MRPSWNQLSYANKMCGTRLRTREPDASREQTWYLLEAEDAVQQPKTKATKQRTTSNTKKQNRKQPTDEQTTKKRGDLEKHAALQEREPVERRSRNRRKPKAEQARTAGTPVSRQAKQGMQSGHY